MSEIQMHRTDGGFASLKKPGDFFWTYGGGRGRHPARLWYLNPHGRVGSITINPNKQENGASWDWTGDLDRPTITPSINETQPNASPTDWHGFIKAGRMSDA